MIYRLKKNFEFKIIYRRGKSFANDLLVMYILKNRKNRDKYLKSEYPSITCSRILTYIIS